MVSRPTRGARRKRIPAKGELFRPRPRSRPPARAGSVFAPRRLAPRRPAAPATLGAPPPRRPSAPLGTPAPLGAPRRPACGHRLTMHHCITSHNVVVDIMYIMRRDLPHSRHAQNASRRAFPRSLAHLSTSPPRHTPRPAPPPRRPSATLAAPRRLAPRRLRHSTPSPPRRPAAPATLGAPRRLAPRRPALWGDRDSGFREGRGPGAGGPVRSLRLANAPPMRVVLGETSPVLWG